MVSIAAAGTTAVAAALSSYPRPHLRLSPKPPLGCLGPLEIVQCHGSLDCAQYLDDKLYHGPFSGIDKLGVLLHSATLAGLRKATQLICAPVSHAILAGSAGKNQCQGDSNCGSYTGLPVPV